MSEQTRTFGQEGAGFLFAGGGSVRLSGRPRRTDGAFTLLELMIACVVMAIIFMGLISSITAAFLSTNMANKASEAQATARRMLEEAMELSRGDMLLLDGNSVITADGLAAKYQVFETSPGLLMLEVEVCRPTRSVSLAELAAMSMDDFHDLEVISGSRVRFMTLSTGAMERATVTNQTGGAVGTSGTIRTGGLYWYE
jgi:type II secretory pathway pseudopilin PulG